MAVRSTRAQIAAARRKSPQGASGEARGAYSEALAALAPKRGGNARRTVVDGIIFDSKAEARRYGELKLMEKAGQISGLQTKTSACKFPLTCNGVKVADYVADFVYVENGVKITEDSKSGVITAVYRLKRKMMLACHGITIRETK